MHRIPRDSIRLTSLKLLVALLGIVSGLGCGGSGGDSSPNRESCELLTLGEKVILGNACDSSRSPVVAISINSAEFGPSTCSGTMISPTHVLTAGNCVALDPTGVTVIAGNTSISAQRIFIHPLYQVDNQRNVVFNDAAIIELQSAAPVRSLPFLASVPITAGETVSLFGYGADEQGTVGQLRGGKLQVVSVSENHLTAIFSGNGVNSCRGDSGGPLIVERVTAAGQSVIAIVGIASTGTDLNCGIGDISTYTNAQRELFLDFIKSVVPGVTVF